MAKYIWGLHYLTICGILLIGLATILGTFLIHRGNSIKNEESNIKLRKLANEQKIKIDSIKGQNSVLIEKSDVLSSLSSQQNLTLEEQNNLIEKLNVKNKELSRKVDALNFPIPEEFFVELYYHFKLDKENDLSEDVKKLLSQKAPNSFSLGIQPPKFNERDEQVQKLIQELFKSFKFSFTVVDDNSWVMVDFSSNDIDFNEENSCALRYFDDSDSYWLQTNRFPVEVSLKTFGNNSLLDLMNRKVIVRMSISGVRQEFYNEKRSEVFFYTEKTEFGGITIIREENKEIIGKIRIEPI